MSATIRSSVGKYTQFGYSTRSFSFSEAGSPSLVAADPASLALHPYVMRCITLRAQAVASLTYLREDGSRVPASSRLFSLCESSLCTHGAAWIERRTMRVLNPSAMTVEANPRDGITAHVWRAGGLVRRYSPDELIYVALWSPSSDVGPGVAPLRVAQESARTALAAEAFTAQFFNQGALPPVIIEPPEGAMLTDADADAIRAVWQRLVSGVRNAWRALVLRRSMKVTALDMPSLDKLAMADVDDIALRRIASAFGVPVTMITDAANYATAKEHRISFWRDTVLPDAELIAEALSAHFGPITINYDDIEALAEDIAEQRRSVIDLHNSGIISADEARAMIGLPNQKQSEPEAGPEIDESALSSALDEVDAWRRKSQARGEICAEFAIRAMPREWANAIRALAERGRDPFGWARHIKAKAPVREKEENKLIAAIAAVFEKHMPKDGEKWDQDAMAESLLNSVHGTLFDVALEEAVAAMIQAASYADIEKAYDFVSKWAAGHSDKLAKAVASTSGMRIGQAIETARRQNWSFDNLVGQFESILSRSRAEMIATTELTRAYSQGTEIARQILADEGIALEHVWRTARDEMVCPICAPRNDRYRHSNWTELPPAHPNCRCWTTLERKKRGRV